MSIAKIFRNTLAAITLLTLAACGGQQTQTILDGDRVQGEIIRSAGGLYGDDVTTGVVDYADRGGNWRSQDFLVTSTSFAKMITTALVPGVAVASIQSDIARYQIDNECDSACGDITTILSASSSTSVSAAEAAAIAQILRDSGHSGS
jgi:hypothetical protein